MGKSCASLVSRTDNVGEGNPNGWCKSASLGLPECNVALIAGRKLCAVSPLMSCGPAGHAGALKKMDASDTMPDRTTYVHADVRYEQTKSSV